MKHAVSFISLLLAMSVSAQTYDFERHMLVLRHSFFPRIGASAQG